MKNSIDLSVSNINLQSTLPIIEASLVSDHITEKQKTKAKRAGAFTDNMSLPVHRWFRYSAGFSAEWVEKIIVSKYLGPNDIVFDPFAGSGTTLLAAQKNKIKSYGAESHPFMQRIANIKLNLHGISLDKIRRDAQNILDIASEFPADISENKSLLISKCYSKDSLSKLMSLKEAYLKYFTDKNRESEIIWLAITAILRECSFVGTAQWQYVLPNKRKLKTVDPFFAFGRKIKTVCDDIESINDAENVSVSRVYLHDARDVASITELEPKVKLVVTSPPYPNNYDYADATRLEMTFWGEIAGWGDLQQAVRRHLIRSCSQHSAAERLSLDNLLNEDVVAPIRDELNAVCSQLAAIRLTKGGKKTYHTMIAAYFIDLAKVLISLNKICASNAEIYFVVGDSAPYGVHVPVEKWLGELAIAAGFSSWAFEKLRDRNTKWKNRKHTVPLKEGILLIRK